MINLAAEEGVWAPTILVRAPEDYWTSAANYVSIGLVGIHAYIVGPDQADTIEEGFIVEMIDGNVYLRYGGRLERRLALARAKFVRGNMGPLSDGFEAAGFEINRVVSELNR